MSSDNFNYLLIGVKEYLESKQKYPYPDLLHQGMNALSLEIKKTVTFPKTMQSFLKLLEEPVNDYCPPKWIPSEFDGDFGLLDAGSLRIRRTRTNTSQVIVTSRTWLRFDGISGT